MHQNVQKICFVVMKYFSQFRYYPQRASFSGAGSHLFGVVGKGKVLKKVLTTLCIAKWPYRAFFSWGGGREGDTTLSSCTAQDYYSKQIAQKVLISKTILNTAAYKMNDLQKTYCNQKYFLALKI